MMPTQSNQTKNDSVHAKPVNGEHGTENKNDNEKKFDINALIEKGKAKGSLSNSEIMEALEDVD